MPARNRTRYDLYTVLHSMSRTKRHHIQAHAHRADTLLTRRTIVICNIVIILATVIGLLHELFF